MAARRQKIVDAAENLIRKTGSTEFTMAQLAKAADMSRATTFNLFDSKLAVLYALLYRSLDGIDDMRTNAPVDADPFVHLMHAASDVSRFFIADASFYQALYRVLLGVSDPAHRPAYLERARLYWQEAVSGIGTAGLFTAEFPPEQLALELVTHYLGVMDLWIHGEIDDAEFLARPPYSALLLTLGLAAGKQRGRVMQLLGECRSKLPPETSFTKRTGRRNAKPPSEISKARRPKG